MKKITAVMFAVGASLTGCGGGSSELDSNKATEGEPARVIVAVIDSAFNPYHEYFREGSPIYPAGSPPSSVTPEVLAAFGITESRIMDLTRSGNFAKDIKADEAQWAAVRSGKAYWFKGTNVIGISFGITPPLKPDVAKDPHGVGTHSRVLAANPDAIIVFVEGTGGESEKFAMNHPAIDIISTSYGIPGSVPLPGHIEDSYTGVYGMGKLHFGAADNSPALSPGDTTSGPWWSIGIAGLEEASSNGRQVLSGNLVDFIADFSQEMPYCVDCERGTDSVSGTSFATPTSAGVTSKVLLEARRATGHAGGIRFAAGLAPAMVDAGGKTLTNWQIRRALEEAAWVPGLEDYDPVTGLFDLAYPIPPAAPWTVLGWGVLSPDPVRGVVSEALAQLGLGAASRSKDPGFCEHQTALIDGRKAYWDTVNVGSESFQNAPNPDPFVYCSGLLPAP